jgi:hypothetical protein
MQTILFKNFKQDGYGVIMEHNFTTADAMPVIATASSDCHPGAFPEIKEDDIDVVYFAKSYCMCGDSLSNTMCKSWCDSGSIAVFSLKNGKYIIAQEDSDTSGHG